MSSNVPLDREVPVRRNPRRRPSAQPAVSVVVASNRSPQLLHACLGSLIPQCSRKNAEVIVARAGDAAETAALARRYPRVRFVAVRADATIPHLRGAGMSAADGDIVAVTEDNCVAEPHWVEMLVSGVSAGADVAGGGVDNAQRERVVDWAAYFTEYGFFSTTRPAAQDTAPLLTGANVAYSRRVVDQVLEWANNGEWENVAHDRLFGGGSVLRFVRTAAVSQNDNYRFWSFCMNRYEHGRDYARKRVTDAPVTRRWPLLACTPLLPVLLTARVARAAAPTRWGPFLKALPATFAFMAAWSLGEAAGYITGGAPQKENSDAER